MDYRSRYHAYRSGVSFDVYEINSIRHRFIWELKQYIAELILNYFFWMGATSLFLAMYYWKWEALGLAVLFCVGMFVAMWLTFRIFDCNKYR